jgi:hypothetical protein
MGVRLDTGMRSVDLYGILYPHGIQVINDGVMVRSWQPKGKRNQWSQWFTIAHTKVRCACTHCSLIAWLERIKDLPRGTIKTKEGIQLVTCKPVWCGLKAEKSGSRAGTHVRLQKSTLETLLKKWFEEFDSPSSGPVHESFSLHSTRHAMFSYLTARGVAKERIMQHAQIKTEAVMFDRYVKPVATWPMVSDIPDNASIADHLRAGFYFWLSERYTRIFRDFLECVGEEFRYRILFYIFGFFDVPESMVFPIVG